MKTVFALVVIFVSTVLNAVAQNDTIQPKIFSQEAAQEKYIRSVYVTTVSDGYVIKGFRRLRFTEPFNIREDLGLTMMKINLDGMIDSFVEVYKDYDLIGGLISPMTSFDDTVVVMTYDRQFPSGRDNGHPAIFRYDKDLNFIDFTTQEDNQFGLMLYDWTSGADAIIDLKTGVRIIAGGYANNNLYNTTVYGHKIRANGELESTPMYGNFPFRFNSISVGSNRLLLTGQLGFSVLDTNFNVIVNYKSWPQNELPPFVNTGFGGLDSRGIAINKSYYYMLGAGNTDLQRQVLSVQKWNDNGEIVSQKSLVTSYDRDVGLPHFQAARGQPNYLYDGDTTIYALSLRFGDLSGRLPKIDTRWYITAIDTNLNLLWTRSIVADDYRWPNAITFSPDSTQLLVVGKDEYDDLETPGQLYTYLLDTKYGLINNAGPAVQARDATFLYPSLASTDVYIDRETTGDPVVRVRLFSLEDGREYVRPVGSGGQFSVADLAPGAYVAYGYSSDEQPYLRQKIVVVR